MSTQHLVRKLYVAWRDLRYAFNFQQAGTTMFSQILSLNGFRQKNAKITLINLELEMQNENLIEKLALKTNAERKYNEAVEAERMTAGRIAALLNPILAMEKEKIPPELRKLKKNPVAMQLEQLYTERVKNSLSAKKVYMACQTDHRLCELYIEEYNKTLKSLTSDTQNTRKNEALAALLQPDVAARLKAEQQSSTSTSNFARLQQTNQRIEETRQVNLENLSDSLNDVNDNNNMSPFDSLIKNLLNGEKLDSIYATTKINPSATVDHDEGELFALESTLAKNTTGIIMDDSWNRNY